MSFSLELAELAANASVGSTSSRVAPELTVHKQAAKAVPASQFLSSFCVIGVSFKNADLDLREKLSFTPDSAGAFLESVRKQGLSECVVLSTCNRSEIYFIGENSSLIESSLAIFCGVSPHHLPEHIYRKFGKDAVFHLFTVASGLDSAVLGETEILSQVKEAWARSKNLEQVGSRLDLMLQRALVASKRVRTETNISRHVTSVASLAVRHADRDLNGLAGKSIAIVGAGKTAKRVAKEVSELNPSRLIILNRTVAHAEKLAREHGGTAHSIDDLDSTLRLSDAIFVAINVEKPLLLKEHFAERKGRAFVVDLSVPRGCDELVAALDHVKVVDLDVLSEECVSNTGRRTAEVPKGMEILEEELVQFAELCIAREASNLIQKLQKLGDKVCADNLAYLADRVGELDEEGRLLVEEMGSRVAVGLIQQAIQKLRDPRLDASGRALIAEAFGISEGSRYRF